jgi:hypothetical protein
MKKTIGLYALTTIAVMAFFLQVFAVDNSSKVNGKACAKTAQASKLCGDTLVVTARLVEIPGKFAPNDLYNYVYIMKYRIVKVIRGSYNGTEILVGHYNPLIPRKQIKDKMTPLVKGDVVKFEVNAKHELVLIKPIERVWKDAVEDEYTDSDLDKYFALKADYAK